MNKVILIGRIVDKPVLKELEKTNIANYKIAVNKKFGEDNADFFNCTSFGKIAVFANKYLNKGSKVAIYGNLQNNTYTNKEGIKVYQTVIIVTEIEFAESKKSPQTIINETTEKLNKNGTINVNNLATPDEIVQKIEKNLDNDVLPF